MVGKIELILDQYCSSEWNWLFVFVFMCMAELWGISTIIGWSVWFKTVSCIRGTPFHPPRHSPTTDLPVFIFLSLFVFSLFLLSFHSTPSSLVSLTFPLSPSSSLFFWLSTMCLQLADLYVCVLAVWVWCCQNLCACVCGRKMCRHSFSLVLRDFL